ncbi:putative c6 zinc finger domain containing protein [Golovinomyces cichoracearum]|uniref:Putative c6 zinc finger domain containing protein n=1 Tax=Golovinomyces cichoracearum TaxID=62708 RepID=A0A420JAZ4_9PEZI|nr:putative c6 zinc finger domain containing protein [Golovinomyces cichoracearum]
MDERVPFGDPTGVGGRSTNDEQGENWRGLARSGSSKLHSIQVPHLEEFQNAMKNFEIERKCRYRLAEHPMLMSTSTSSFSLTNLSRSHQEILAKVISSGVIAIAIGSHWINCSTLTQVTEFASTNSNKSNFPLYFFAFTSTLILYSSCIAQVTATSNWPSKDLPQTVTHEVPALPESEPGEHNQFEGVIDKTVTNNTQLVERNSETTAQAAEEVSKTPLHLMGNSDKPTTGSTAWKLPTPFDVGFSHNITNQCQDFMTEMIQSPGFKQCSPISMILLNSNSFFQATKHLPRITALLDLACSAPVSSCTDLLNSYARNLTSSKTCASDLSNSNPQIDSALIGLRSYRTLYTATCLHSSNSNTSENIGNYAIHPSNSANNVSEESYCFANAITNLTNPTNSYIYYLPLNVSLVGSAIPACNNCLQSTMSVFQQATANRSDVLAGNYVKAASQINVVCGPQFVNASLVAAISLANIKSVPNWPIVTYIFIWLILSLL